MIVRALLALSLILALSPPAAADTPARRRIVAVLDVRVDGVPKDIAAQFQDDLEKQLDSRSYWLARRTRVRELLESSTRWTEGCVLGPCLAEVRTQTGADLVLLAAITGADNSFGYVVTLVRTDNGRYLSQEANRCEVCTVHEALASAIDAAVKLVTAVPETLPDDAAAARTELDRVTVAHTTAHAATRRRHRTIAIATTLAGLVLAGAGTALYFARDRSDAGLVTAAAGGGLAVGGMIALTF